MNEKKSDYQASGNSFDHGLTTCLEVNCFFKFSQNEVKPETLVGCWVWELTVVVEGKEYVIG